MQMFFFSIKVKLSFKETKKPALTKFVLFFSQIPGGDKAVLCSDTRDPET